MEAHMGEGAYDDYKKKMQTRDEDKQQNCFGFYVPAGPADTAPANTSVIDHLTSVIDQSQAQLKKLRDLQTAG